jgi:predicted Rossmann fold nucleotide-binding protein DprA/Smf involved in DNA uptake
LNLQNLSSFIVFKGRVVYQFVTLNYNFTKQFADKMKRTKIKTIISGGQTGADRAALDFALENNIEISGYVPKNRRAEDGKISECYSNLTETATRDYSERTELNVQNSDATLIVSHGRLTRGSLLTKKFAAKHRKPFLHVDFLQSSIEEAAESTREWLASVKCKRLNIAGPRASTDPEIYEKTKRFLAELFAVK